MTTKRKVNIFQDTRWYPDGLHALAGYAVAMTSAYFGFNLVYATIAILTYAGFKEYWYDAKYEKTPPQDFWENTRDFTGYLAGTVVALALMALVELR